MAAVNHEERLDDEKLDTEISVVMRRENLRRFVDGLYVGRVTLVQRPDGRYAMFTSADAQLAVSATRGRGA